MPAAAHTARWPELKIIVRGIVQGVGFRPYVARTARRLGLHGYVKNVGSFVEIYIDGSEEVFLKAFMEHLPPLSRVDSVDVRDSPPEMLFNSFEIVESRGGYKNYMFPSDTALCDECVNEIFDRGNRRYLYPFTNCVNCGARYSVIYDLPFDRERTSMGSFQMCQDCLAEYGNDGNRRFDAQTISCAACGPSYALYDRTGARVETDDPVSEYSRVLDEGFTGVAKSWGGMHLSVVMDRAAEFRSWYRRPTKPFAIMVRNADVARRFAFVDSDEERLLLSPQRPIVLLQKKEPSDEVLEAVSPGLPNVGIYLPYSGMHHILFSRLKHDALISTSCNFADEPMIVENEEVFQLNADFYLLHNRKIVNRVDDSVVRVQKGRSMFIRRSRGYVPDAVNVHYRGNYLSLGAEMNSRISLSKDGFMFSSQYLGDISHYNNLMFLEETARGFMKMLDVERLDGISIDMHPQFSYRRFARELAVSSTADVIEVQHHHAHAASLLLDNGLERAVAITLDGTGYGTDGVVWGGEVLDAGRSTFDRIGSLEEVPLVGGENAIREPMRLVYTLNELTGGHLQLDYDRDLYSRMIGRSVRTTSFGRVLDALAAYLGICRRMHYDGEPAMRLEQLLSKGTHTFEFETEVLPVEGRLVVRVLPLFDQLFRLRLESERQRADAAYSLVDTLVARIAELSADYAARKGLQVGLTGGVSYNPIIAGMMERAAGTPVVSHRAIPNGDNGISAGQNVVAAELLAGK